MEMQERVFLTPENEADWLSMREVDVTSTEVAALFECHSYGLTEFSLYHRKRGTLEDDFKSNDRMKWGNRLEAAIAAGIAEDLGLIAEPMKVYGRIPSLRMGSSFDFKIVGLDDAYEGEDETYRDLFREHGTGILEVKNVDGLVFKRGWLEEDGAVEAPPQIEMQIQHQLEVSGFGWALGAPLIGGNTPKPFYRIRDREIGHAIRERVADFWSRVDAGDEPDPDYNSDAGAISKLYFESNGEEIDMSGDERLDELCAAHKEASDDEKDANGRKEAAKAEMLTIIGSAGKVITSNGSISAKTVAENPGTLITADMVGKRVGSRKGYRNFRLYMK